jgi:nicotinate-nucleotide adenylyltransferase
MKRIGIFGGTFNPIHNTHLSIANKFVEQAQIDFCYFVPAFISPFKINEANNLSEANHRANMVNLAIEANPKFRICTYEIEKAGVSYSFDTLQYLKKNHETSQFYILIGADQAIDFKKWSNWEKILNQAILYVVPRPGNTSEKDIQIINSLLPGGINWLVSETSDISASSIRESVKNNKSIQLYVPLKVEEYIKKNGLYK